MQPTGELNQRGRVQRLKEGAVHAREVDRGVLAHRLHSESDQRPRRYPDHPLWVTSPQFGQGEVNGYEITRVAVVGTGVIGASWAAYFLARGLEVIATDPAPDAEDKLRADVAR